MIALRGAGMLALTLLCASVAAATDEAASPYAGEDVCRACHEEAADAYMKTPHAAPLSDPARPEPMRACEACHGPGQAHADAGGSGGDLETFARTRPATARSAVCLKCHAGGAGLHDFRRGEHAMAAVACNDCHRLHTGKGDALLAKPPPGLCYDCHLEVRAKFALTEHHKVNEGVLTCLDCHEVHGSRTPPLMRGANDRPCFRCHADVEGPFVFEHAGQVTEGCVRCHDPHGSVNRHLLIRQQVAQLCYECHSVTPSDHLQPSYRDCTRCHVDIHGSNLDPRFLER
jgi:DmsE family decaheme c-type cytochrome